MFKGFWKLIVMIGLVVTGTTARTEPFILGSDISWVQQDEESGTKFADKGAVKDIFAILKDHRFNWIRLRLFVDPTAKVSDESESPYSTQGYCDLTHTRAVAKRIKAAGMNLLLDFHYSDTWADPGKQHKPVSWEGLSFNDLKAKVRSYTKETLEAFKSDGTLPDMVQVGNEIVGGMIWPDGKSGNMSNFAALVNAGIDGVKDADPNIKIMIHSISENSPSNWLKSLMDAGVKRIDVFGLSYYSQYHGSPDDLQKRINDVVANHSVKIAIAEYDDNHERVNDIIYNIPNERGLGTFVWEPTRYGDSALFDWKNSRREANSRIDLYPKLSKEFGNDDISAADGNRQENKWFRNVNGQSGNYRIWRSPDGLLRFESSDNIEKTISLFNYQGRMIGRWRMFSPGRYNLTIYKQKTASMQPGIYTAIIDNRDGGRKIQSLEVFSK